MIDPGGQRIAKFSIRKASNIFVLVLISALTLAAFWPAFELPAMPMEEGLLLVYPEMLLKGQRRIGVSCRFMVPETTGFWQQLTPFLGYLFARSDSISRAGISHKNAESTVRARDLATGLR